MGEMKTVQIKSVFIVNVLFQDKHDEMMMHDLNWNLTQNQIKVIKIV